MVHWLTSYIGKSYLLGAPGPNAFDCWSFVFWVLIHHYGHTNSKFEDWSALRNSSSSSCWHSLNRSNDGAVVMMEVAQCPHVGIWIEIDQGGIAHCMEGYGVIFTPLSALHAISCRVIGFYGFSEISQ